MKVLIQQPGEQCWLCADDTWTQHVQEARDFYSVAEAVIYCSKRNIRYQILLTFEDSQYNLTLGDGAELKNTRAAVPQNQ